MIERDLHLWITYGLVAAAVLTFVSLLWITAPYGRHTRAGFGPSIAQRTAWIVMESPAVFVWGAIYFAGTHALETVPLTMAAIWQLHYVQRVFVFPFRIRSQGKTTPLAVVGAAIFFNVVNAYVNARWISELGAYPVEWMDRPSFWIGFALFVVGLAGNIHADDVLRKLRAPGKSDYQIPRGGLYELVSCPNYLMETIEWIGWAILTWSLSGAAFALYTAANLVPRALAHHRWYKERFPDYPRGRRAVIPYVL